MHTSAIDKLVTHTSLALWLRDAAIAGTARNSISQLPFDTTAASLGPLFDDLAKVLGDTVTHAGQLDILRRKTLGAVCRPTDEGGVVYLYAGGEFWRGL